MTLPTRIQKIGGCYGFFYACYKQGQLPFIIVGPNYIIFSLLLIGVLCWGSVLVFVATTLIKSDDGNVILWFTWPIVITIFINLLCFLRTALGDFGVPESVLIRYSAKQYPEEWCADGSKIEE